MAKLHREGENRGEQAIYILFADVLFFILSNYLMV
jgi:hypothetical protein